ncbi:MAG: RagB/SusD family nutrient uptake outer membrane protein, partial [Odoribacter sp.]|nr:RagB/SusD family nutrient uptake outer membrane protein [Odoribacter sp.]
MKNKWILILCFCCTGLFSCNEWLDVKPRTEVELNDMYRSQQGFQDALIGAYLHMKSGSAYGGSLMYGNIEYLAQHWDAKTTVAEEMSRYNYKDKDVEKVFKDIYSQLYTIIADVNAILENIDEKQGVFEKGMYNIVKGEALAIRAYCHFDVLRLFGPMPTRVHGSRILPYVKSVTIAYHDQYTYDKYVSLLEADLLQADSLLKVADPVIAEYADPEVSVAAQAFLVARQMRLNYYAVKALEARFYLWMGGAENRRKAYACAKEVKEARNAKGNLLYALGNTRSISNEDFSFSSEHVAAIYDYELYTTANTVFKENASYAKAQKIVVPDLYAAGTTDIRYTGLWTERTAT